MNVSKDGILPWLDYVFILRPTLLFPVWLMCLAGYRYGLDGAPRHSVVYVLFLLSLFAGAIYLFNQIADKKSDAINKKLFLVAQGHISLRAAVVEGVLLLIISIALAFYTSIPLGLLFTALLLMGMLYNYKLKNYAWGGLILNAASGGTLVFSIGWLCAGPFSAAMVLHSLPYWPAIAGVFLVTTVLDETGDRQTGKQTFCVVFGPVKTMAYAVILLLITTLAAILTRDVVLAVAAFCACPFFVWSFVRNRIEVMLMGAKTALLAFALVLCYWFPALIIFLIVTFFGARWYYKNRFNLNYPYIFGGIL